MPRCSSSPALTSSAFWRVCVAAKFRNCGQVCISPSRFFVQPVQVLARFASLIAERLAALSVSGPRLAGTEVGPLADARRRGPGRKTLSPMPQPRAPPSPPEVTVATQTAPAAAFSSNRRSSQMSILRWPSCRRSRSGLVPVTGFADLDDGLAQANATTYGFAGYVLPPTTSLRPLRRAKASKSAWCGSTNFALATAEAPFGGVKGSGFGREGGSEGIEPYLVTKYVNMKLTK